MTNPWAGEVSIVINGQTRVMKLTLGALAGLETRLGADSLVDLIARFESGACRSVDVLALITAGLSGAGTPMSEAELVNADFNGGPVAAAQAAAQLLALSFNLPEGTL